MYIQAMIKYFKAILDLINGNGQEETVLRIIEMYEFLELDSKKEQCQTFYNKVRSLYSII